MRTAAYRPFPAAARMVSSEMLRVVTGIDGQLTILRSTTHSTERRPQLRAPTSDHGRSCPSINPLHYRPRSDVDERLVPWPSACARRDAAAPVRARCGGAAADRRASSSASTGWSSARSCRRACDTVLVPLGTLEPHGVTANGADIIAPVAIARAIAPRVNAMIAPGWPTASPARWTRIQARSRSRRRRTGRTSRRCCSGLAKNRFRTSSCQRSRRPADGGAQCARRGGRSRSRRAHARGQLVDATLRI